MRLRISIEFEGSTQRRKREPDSQVVTFSFPPGKIEEVQRYAIAKGFVTAADMARYATFRFMGQYPVDGRKHSRKSGDSHAHGNEAEPQAEALPESLEPSSTELKPPAESATDRRSEASA